MVGEGLAIKAHEESKVIAPFNGLVSMIVPTKHAVGIQSEDGVDIVIHIGVNTVDLEGKGFKCFVKQTIMLKQGKRCCNSTSNIYNNKATMLTLLSLLATLPI